MLTMCPERWLRELRTFNHHCCDAYVAAAQDSAGPRLVATVYAGMPVGVVSAVFMQSLLPVLRTAWPQLDAAAVRWHSTVLSCEVQNWLQHVLDSMRLDMAGLIHSCREALQQRGLWHLIPALRDLTAPAAGYELDDLEPHVALPLALGSVMALAEAGIQQYDDDDDDGYYVPTADTATAIADNMRTCFLFDGLLTGRAHVWGSEQDLQLEAERRLLVEAVQSLQSAAAAPVSTVVPDQMQQRVLNLTAQLDAALALVDSLQQRLPVAPTE